VTILSKRETAFEEAVRVMAAFKGGGFLIRK
jgi:hypothetical protein